MLKEITEEFVEEKLESILSNDTDFEGIYLGEKVVFPQELGLQVQGAMRYFHADTIQDFKENYLDLQKPSTLQQDLFDCLLGESSHEKLQSVSRRYGALLFGIKESKLKAVYRNKVIEELKSKFSNHTIPIYLYRFLSGAFSSFRDTVNLNGINFPKGSIDRKVTKMVFKRKDDFKKEMEKFRGDHNYSTLSWQVSYVNLENVGVDFLGQLDVPSIFPEAFESYAKLRIKSKDGSSVEGYYQFRAPFGNLDKNEKIVKDIQESKLRCYSIWISPMYQPTSHSFSSSTFSENPEGALKDEYINLENFQAEFSNLLSATYGIPHISEIIPEESRNKSRIRSFNPVEFIETLI
jgi:hypothetical protein